MGDITHTEYIYYITRLSVMLTVTLVTPINLIVYMDHISLKMRYITVFNRIVTRREMMLNFTIMIAQLIICAILAPTINDMITTLFALIALASIRMLPVEYQHCLSIFVAAVYSMNL